MTMNKIKTFNIILALIAMISADLSSAQFNDKVFITIFMGIVIAFWLSVKPLTHSKL
jgi:hypothetical protein